MVLCHGRNGLLRIKSNYICFKDVHIMYNNKKIALILIIITILFMISAFLIYDKKIRYSEEQSDFLVWSTGDCNGAYAVLGMRTDNVTGIYNGDQVYPIDSLNNGKFVGLKYPLQVNDIIYYTTTNVETMEDCIISKNGNDIEYIISNNIITHKRVVEDNLYYIVKHDASTSYDMCEIHCFNLKYKTNKMLIDNINANANFDVDDKGNILYINSNNEVVLWGGIENKKTLGTGRTACFWKDDYILIVKDTGLYSFSINNNSSKKLCNATGYHLELSSSNTYVALQDSVSSKSAIKNDYIQVVDLEYGRIEKIKTTPNVVLGFSWLNNCNPIY